MLSSEHRLVSQHRRAGHHSVWSLACQDHVAGCHWGRSCLSRWCPSPCLSHLLLLLSFRSFQVGSGFANHSSYWYRRSGYQGAEEDADQLLLTD